MRTGHTRHQSKNVRHGGGCSNNNCSRDCFLPATNVGQLLTWRPAKLWPRRRPSTNCFVEFPDRWWRSSFSLQKIWLATRQRTQTKHFTLEPWTGAEPQNKDDDGFKLRVGASPHSPTGGSTAVVMLYLWSAAPQVSRRAGFQQRRIWLQWFLVALEYFCDFHLCPLVNLGMIYLFICNLKDVAKKQIRERCETEKIPAYFGIQTPMISVCGNA